MSEQMLQDDALEQRLRAHYASEYGQPPAPSAIWEGISAELGLATPGRTNAERADQAPHDTTDHPLPPQPAMRGDRRPWPRRLLPLVAAALVVAVFAMLLLGPLGRSGHGLQGGKIAAPTDTPIPTLPPAQYLGSGGLIAGVSLSDVQMVSAGEGWAVGSKRVSNTEFDSLVMHYTGNRWVEAPTLMKFSQLEAVSMDSPDNGWVGGSIESSPRGALLLHYTGGQWIRVPLPDLDNILRIQMLSAEEGWAIGNTWDHGGAPHFHLLHYFDSVWSVDTTETSVVALSMVSASEGWAAGLNGLLLHFHDGQWTTWGQRIPGDVTALSMVSANDGWLSGVAPSIYGDQEHRTFMMHFDGRTWNQVDLPGTQSTTGLASNPIGSISLASAREGWAVGTWNSQRGFLYHFVDGAWQPTSYDAYEPLTSVAMVTANEGWAVGANMQGNDAGQILHYSHGTWTVYQP